MILKVIRCYTEQYWKTPEVLKILSSRGVEFLSQRNEDEKIFNYFKVIQYSMHWMS